MRNLTALWAIATLATSGLGACAPMQGSPAPSLTSGSAYDEPAPSPAACSGGVALSAGAAGAAASGYAASRLAQPGGDKKKGKPSVSAADAAKGAKALSAAAPTLTVAGGSVAGGFLAAKLACLLTRAEQQQAQGAALQAVEGGIGSRVAWQSTTRPDVSGRSTVTSQSKDDTGAVCRQVTTVVIVKGEETAVDQRLCRAAGATGFAVAEQ